MRTLASLLFAIATAALPAAQAQEPPARVGRIAHIEGQASLYQDPDAGWEKAYVNSPITSENSVWTDAGSRAELRVSGTALRMDELTQLDIARLDDEELDAYIGRGSVAVRVRHYEKNEQLVFHTLNTRVRLRADGRYRVDVDHERQETRVTVFAGEARIGADDGRMRVAAGRSVLVFGIERPEFVEEAAKGDTFDRWTLARDERWREGQAPTYVSTQMTGYEDLDAYGTWAQEPEYGALWYPSRVASTWAPYRYGHWSHVRPWGWTWVDDAPWGYAPFHYGRWVYVRNRWAWYPGERVARPVWAPAMVAWVGGSNFSVGVSGGPSVGWYPLSPWDRYDPWYRASPTYVNRVNVIVRNDKPTRDDRRHWQEWTRERGTTVVDRGAFVDRKPIAQAAIPLTMDAIRRAPRANQPETLLPSRNDYISRRRQQPQPAVPAPTAPAVAQAQGQPGASQQPPGRSAIVRPNFDRRATVAAPQQASAPPGRRPETAQQPASAPPGQRPATAQPPASREERERAVRQQTDQAIRDAQQQGQAQERAQREAQQAQERAQRETQQAQERAQREAGQQQQQQQRQAQERAQREAQQAQQAQERAQREAAQQTQQQQQQRQAQERAQREAQQAQQAQERAQREAAQQTQQQQQQRQAQERAQREAQQAQERAQREAAQQQQQQQRQPQQSREDKERAVRQQTDQAIKDAQRQGQDKDRAQREAQQQQQAAERAAREAAARQQREKDKEKEDKDKEKENKGKGSKP